MNRNQTKKLIILLKTRNNLLNSLAKEKVATKSLHRTPHVSDEVDPTKYFAIPFIIFWAIIISLYTAKYLYNYPIIEYSIIGITWLGAIVLIYYASKMSTKIIYYD